MDSAPMSVVSDDREEGEIVDDDFEDISDNSIIDPIGKSVSSKDHLPAISLSSVTEAEEPRCEKKFDVKSRRREEPTNPTKGEEIVTENQLALKAAIRVDNKEVHKNSLRSRLRAMTKLDHDSDNFVEKNGTDTIEQKASSDDGDSELTQLRLEALRTAVLNKCMHRKKRKVKEMQDNDILSDISVKTDTSETNKENTRVTNENVNARVEENYKKICLEKPVENGENAVEITNNSTPPEDDEDVLRALLLASMSKRITKEVDTKRTILLSNSNNLGYDKLKNTLNTKTLKNEIKNVTKFNLKNCVIKNKVLTTNQPVQLPKVKPLIININTESDTDDDSLNKTIKNAFTQAVGAKKITLEIENNVEKFLKEQRAKVEAQLSSIPNKLLKGQSAKFDKQLSPISNNPGSINKPVTLEKSSVKLLPKVKQIEYQKLLQKLKNAEKKPRIRRSSHKFNSEGKSVGFTSKKFIRTKVPVNKQVNNAPKLDEVPDLRNDVKTLQKTLKGLQIQKNGSLGKPGVVEDSKTRFTSTPIKETPSFESFDTSSLHVMTPNSENVSINIVEPPVEIRKEEDTVEPINPGDPNDIDKIYNIQRNSLPKYISPLDNVKRALMDDPFSIVCPYDVDGNCRDPECIYKHLFN
ncbi:hypothetical protein NQ314_009352 [Rhamnusium bicolor]|uniref:Zinc-finger domain-containing protein n=1 Tax=Rhamnusium bicolor TaxID=1586634 RepID=A0AAV8Y0A3_9CUCU|nr:hypothetical protein NQ314_009352 [Rhamnusium bicolor]